MFPSSNRLFLQQLVKYSGQKSCCESFVLNESLTSGNEDKNSACLQGGNKNIAFVMLVISSPVLRLTAHNMAASVDKKDQEATKTGEKDGKKAFVHRTALDVQRHQLNKLMSDPVSTL